MNKFLLVNFEICLKFQWLFLKNIGFSLFDLVPLYSAILLVVLMCRQRKHFIKHAVDRRYALAAAHVAYIQALNASYYRISKIVKYRIRGFYSHRNIFQMSFILWCIVPYFLLFGTSSTLRIGGELGVLGLESSSTHYNW